MNDVCASRHSLCIYARAPCASAISRVCMRFILEDLAMMWEKKKGSVILKFLFKFLLLRALL